MSGQRPTPELKEQTLVIGRVGLFGRTSFTRRSRGNLATRDVRMRTLSKGLKTKLFGLLGGMSICALGLQPAAAATITFFGTGTGSDGALAASADFTTSAGQLLFRAGLKNLNETISGVSA